jgi:signal transduction histidine kinase
VSPLELSDDERRRLRHDIRTPLTIVTGFAEVLAGESPVTDEDRRDYARRILEAGHEIRVMLDAVFDDPVEPGPPVGPDEPDRA